MPLGGHGNGTGIGATGLWLGHRKKKTIKGFQEVQHDTLQTWNNYWSKSIKVCHHLVLEKISGGDSDQLLKNKKQTNKKNPQKKTTQKQVQKP